jgi:hypothetical protein
VVIVCDIGTEDRGVESRQGVPKVFRTLDIAILIFARNIIQIVFCVFEWNTFRKKLNDAPFDFGNV